MPGFRAPEVAGLQVPCERCKRVGTVRLASEPKALDGYRYLCAHAPDPQLAQPHFRPADLPEGLERSPAACCKAKRSSEHCMSWGTGRVRRAIRARALRGPAWTGRGAVTIGVGGIAFLLNVLLVTAAGAVGAVRLGGRSALLLVLGVHRMLLVVLLLVDTGLGGG
ncbi:unnamed protein product (mitochondrion) [Plasmodiophora brassicae]|uniref:Uncharacterized protein n=1 Tax=Plasmodiophora brassicae TaxID=37360 RepID=A0A3P3YMJ6_PLABS|nr:unnamed protein product [Plasmodiophora brassicae]